MRALSTFLILAAGCAGVVGAPGSSGEEEDGAGLGAGLGSDWHPDPDGDGVLRDADLCPHVYDPGQEDGDGDRRGDACDPDAAGTEPGGPVLDLRAQHVTPYGAWLTFTSPETREYGWEGVLAWSTDRSSVESAEGIRALQEAGQGFEIDVRARAGAPLSRPYVLTRMEPDTTYYVTVRRYADFDSLSSAPGNVLTLTTHPAPEVPAAREHPRVFADPGALEAMRERHLAGAPAFSAAAAEIGPEALEAVGGGAIEDLRYCVPAALLWHATGEPSYRQAARALLSELLAYWEQNELTGNAYRWADASLGACADLLWAELDGATRERVVAAALEEDEGNLDVRADDTDEIAAAARTRLVDGLLACGAPDLDPALSERACAVLEEGLRLFYGVQLVKARRDRGFFAQSGGHLPDGTEYAQGTSAYWLEALLALESAGVPMEEYAPFVFHNFLATSVHPLTPTGRGLAAYGDLDDPENPAEPGGLALSEANGSLIALHAELLERFGRAREAAWARHQLGAYGPDRAASAWPRLLASRQGGAEDYRQELSPAFHDSGLGRFYARSSWSDGASLFVFRAGWSGVDHAHEDAGSFQLYRRGRWITHDVLGYGGAAAAAPGNNVPQLEVATEEGTRTGQFALSPAAPARIRRASSEARYAFASADLLGAYTSHEARSYDYDAAVRRVLWRKTDERGGADLLFLYDLVRGGAERERGAVLHFDAAPEISGQSASLELGGERVQIDVLSPPSASLSVRAPEGSPGAYPAELYTHRLAIDAGDAGETLRMLTLLRAGGEAGAGAELVEGDAVLGALAGADLVLFARAPGAGEAIGSIPAPDRSELRVFWTGLSPGASYRARVDAGRLTVEPGGDLEADAGGVLAFELSGGAISPL